MIAVNIPVTSMTIPFASLRGAWVQECNKKWHRLIVLSGPEQLICSVHCPWRFAGRDQVLREARLCVGNLDSEAAEIIDIATAFENRRIKLGGDEERDNHNKLLRYMITYKMVERAGCVVCPACLRETPVNCSICFKCGGMMMSYDSRPVEIKIANETDDEDEMEIDEGVEVKTGPTAEEKKNTRKQSIKGNKQLTQLIRMALMKAKSTMVMRMLIWRSPNGKRPKERKKSHKTKILRCVKRRRKKEKNMKRTWVNSQNGLILWKLELNRCRLRIC